MLSSFLVRRVDLTEALMPSSRALWRRPRSRTSFLGASLLIPILWVLPQKRRKGSKCATCDTRRHVRPLAGNGQRLQDSIVARSMRSASILYLGVVTVWDGACPSPLSFLKSWTGISWCAGRRRACLLSRRFRMMECSPATIVSLSRMSSFVEKG